MTRHRLALIVLGGTLLVGGVGCGKSQCVQQCERSRDKLIHNFAIPINCADKKWDVDCVACDKLFRDEFFVAVTPSTCAL